MSCSLNVDIMGIGTAASESLHEKSHFCIIARKVADCLWQSLVKRQIPCPRACSTDTGPLFIKSKFLTDSRRQVYRGLRECDCWKSRVWSLNNDSVKIGFRV